MDSAIVSDYRGNFAENNSIPINVISAATDFLTITGLNGIHSGYFSLAGMTTDRVSIVGLTEGGAEIGPLLLRHINHATPGTLIESTALGNGVYEFASTMACAGIKWPKVGVADTVTALGQLSGASA